MAATAAAEAGTMELVDAALAPYAHADLRWLVRRHVLAVLREFPSLSPSVDVYTADDGASAVLLNARGPLAVSGAALPPLLLTVWLPREYPYRRPLVYAFPAAAEAALVPDHPFVDHRTGRVRAAALPYLDAWRVPASSLAGLVRSLVAAFRMCHPLAAVDGFAAEKEEATRLHQVLQDALVARLAADMAAFRDRVHEDVQGTSSLQGCLRARGGAMDGAVRELEDERMRLERAVTASLRHRGELMGWLRRTSPAAEAEKVLEPQVAGGAGDARRWLESKTSELALDDAMDALGHALENGALGFPEYIKRVRVLAREQFIHCYAGSTTLNKSTCILTGSNSQAPINN